MNANENITSEEIETLAQVTHDAIFNGCLDYENLERHIEDYGIDVYYNSETDVDGYLRFADNKPRIVVKNYDNPNYAKRQRFTMAHELGHLILHRNWEQGKEVDSSNDELLEVTLYRGGEYPLEIDDERERQANQFAGAFLMPRRDVAQVLQQHAGDGKMSMDVAKKVIASHFKVSEAAAFMRLKTLLQR
ncbi:ImmA/IrrE family metallo-endopeptidase [Listeria booriae]|uniref:ImmA/IrrE family metallo-endopeptidase n=1 Tax=Listeria booriae TaxID=1552123 RepID=UPI001629053A|nr:ImmA/IrrE family metallo-endopeptidase [Listeria booriae]MBC1230564.1 ImmA/IrrE family metallo-endopeptidase [Listeria booriae]